MVEEKANILGEMYTSKVEGESDNKILDSPDGHCEMRPQKIVSDQEIVRSFLQERGINVSESAGSTGYMATNKTMVEWVAKYDPKVREFWGEAGDLNK